MSESLCIHCDRTRQQHLAERCLVGFTPPNTPQDSEECVLCEMGEGDHICPEVRPPEPDPEADATATLTNELQRTQLGHNHLLVKCMEWLVARFPKSTGADALALCEFVEGHRDAT